MARRLRPASLYAQRRASVLVPLTVFGFMVGVDGLAELYTELSGRLGAPLAPPPTHVTLYTRPNGDAIGVHDESDLRALTEPLRGRRAAEVREAIGFDAVFGS